MIDFKSDPKKSVSNLHKHGVSFEEAATSFFDPFSIEQRDEAHSHSEERWQMLGMSTNERVLFVVYTGSASTVRLISARVAPRPSENSMKKTVETEQSDERTSVDFSKAVRGKYSNLLAKGSNLVILDPALLPYFPDSESVNRALHAFLQMRDSFEAAAPARRRSKRPAVSFDPRIGTKAAAVR